MKGGVRLYTHNNTSEKNWPWWRVVWDLTLHDNTSGKNWPWWRVVWAFALQNIHQKRTDFDEGWCETLHYITIHQKRIDLDEGWCETLHYITIHHKRIDLDEGWCETLHYITIHQKRIDLDEGFQYAKRVDSSTQLKLNHDLNRYHQIHFNLSLPGVNSRFNPFCCWIILGGLNSDLILC